MLAWYGATSPDPGGNPDLAYPPPASPHFRPNMQSPGPPYQGSVASAMSYSDRPYESQMGSHCQTNSYPSYQPPSPYRPHPVSPPAHAHQYGNPGNHQLGLAYSSAHQMSPYGPTQNHYGPMSQELYSNRHSMYSSGRTLQQMKGASWTESATTTPSDILQSYNQPSPRPPMMASPPHMPPPPMHSPHSAMSTTSAPPPTPHPHFRQLAVPSSANHSPHSWSQSQIPSPGTLHSPRTTPSPLPSHARSPAHSQPFSPPPTTPSPHHPPPAITPHPQPQKTAPPSPSALTPTTARQPICTSPTNQVGGSDPLQSLQKMVMLDAETVESPITRASYEMSNSQTNTPVASRPGSYFSSVEQLAGSDPGSPYPTYYNLDQNRLCTPPRTCLSTPTSSTYASAPDSTSSNSPHSDSHTTTVSAESSAVNLVNGEANQCNNQVNRQEFETFTAPEVRITNGSHQNHDPQAREELSRGSSDSDNRDQQEYFNRIGTMAEGRSDIPEDDNSLTNENKDRKSVRGRGRTISHEREICDSSLDNSVERQPKNKPILWSASKRNSTLQEFEITNGQVDDINDENSDHKFASRSPQFYSPVNRWNKISPIEDLGGYSVGRNCIPDECLPISLASGMKRGTRRRRANSGPHIDPDGMHHAWDPIMPGEMRGQKGFRMTRRGSGRRGGRRRAGASLGAVDRYDSRREFNPYSFPHLHPVNGQHSLVDAMKSDKDMGWPGHGGYPIPSLSQGINRDLVPGDDTLQGANSSLRDSPGLGGPIMNPSLPNSYMFPLSPKLPTEIGIDDKSSSMFSSMLTKDNVKYPELIPDGMLGNQTVLPDPNAPQLVPPKKKRGRPCGSKNKPKPPGEQKERRPYKRRKRNDPDVATTEQIRKIRGFYYGPYIHISGTRERPLSITIVNLPPKEDDLKFLKPKRSFPLVIRQKLTIGAEISNSSSPTPTLEMETGMVREKHWVCAFCFKNSHYRGLGDLFGPYRFFDDQKPSFGDCLESFTPPPEPCLDIDDDIEDDVEDDLSSATESCQSNGHFGILSKIRAKRRRSELVHEFLKTTMCKKAKVPVISVNPVVEAIVPVKKIDPEENCDPAGKPDQQNEESEVMQDPSLPPPPPPPPASPPLELPIDIIGHDKEFWVHEDCAVWSQGVCLIGQQLHGLQDAVQDAFEMLCSKCKIQGASLTCLVKECTEQFHYICAIDKGCEMDDTNFTMLCPKHKKKPRMEKQTSSEG